MIGKSERCAAGMAGIGPVGRGQEGGRLCIRLVDRAYCMDDVLGEELEAWGPACLTCRHSRPCARCKGRVNAPHKTAKVYEWGSRG